MAVSPVMTARVSQYLRTFSLLNTVRGTQAGMFTVQNQLATGLKFLTPSENPVGAAQTQAIDAQLERIAQSDSNLREANGVLTATEAALQDAIDLLLEARSRASEAVGDTMSSDDRLATAGVVDSLRDQLVSTANRKHLDRYLFAGFRNNTAPFQPAGEGVLYRGDGRRAAARVDADGSEDVFTISGQAFFSAVGSGVRGYRDLDPALTPSTRLSDLRGANGAGIRLGRITVSDGSQQVEIDLTGAATVGDVIDKLNDGMPATLDALLDTRGITIAPNGSANAVVSVADVGAGRAAADLGLATTNQATAGGVDLDPMLTARTRLADLNGGAGVNLGGGLTIRNGGEAVALDLSAAQTLEDVVNLINEAGIGAEASISADGRGIDVFNRLSGADLRIEENGGVAADALGIRSMHGGTRLSELNDGRGVETLPGDDFRITTSDGTTIDVDVDGVGTLQELIDRINAQGGGAVTAALRGTGNGLLIADNTNGAGRIRIDRINHSPAIDGLGLNVTTSSSTLAGEDVNPSRVDSPFTALVELQRALERNDSAGIQRAAERIESTLESMRRVQGEVAAQAKSMLDRSARLDDARSAMTVLRSDVRDVDLSEAVLKFQQYQTALQANLSTASRVLGLSLMDYLR